VNVSALKSKGSASWRSSIRSLSVLLLALVYLDAAQKEKIKCLLLSFNIWITDYRIKERKLKINYKGSQF
jgi:hypothetical protein